MAVDVGQAEVAAGVAVGELLVVEAQQVQHRGVQVVDVHRFSTARKPNSSVAPWTWPPRTPPPAIHTVKP